MARLCQIKASAGSGKTHTLTERYLRLLARCSFPGKRHSEPLQGGGHARNAEAIAFGDILAITFTNAAVSEIRNRAISRLKMTAVSKKKSREKIRGMDPETAQACLDALLMDMGQMKVRTIDSLLHQIVRSSALRLDLPPDFEPAFSTSAAFEPLLDNFLRKVESGDLAAAKNLDAIAEYFVKHREYTEDAKAGKRFLPEESLLERMKAMLDDALLKAGEGFASREEAEGVQKSLAKSLREAAAKVLAEVDRINAKIAPGKMILKKDPNGALPSLASGDYASIDKYFRPETGDILNKRDGVIPPDITALERAYQNLKDIAPTHKAFTDYLRDAPLITLASALADDLFASLPAGGKLPSALIPLLAARALAHEEGICEAQCQLGRRLTHFMIDEFQDTSKSQWESMAPLVREAVLRDGSLTWVGDVKQSIFMWRDAAPELFDEILDDPELKSLVPEPQRKRLPRNRRSSKIVVEHNNLLFARLAEPEYAEKALTNVFPSTFKAIKEAARRVANAFAGSQQDLPRDVDPGGFVALECLQPQGGKEKKEDDEFHELFEARVANLLKSRHRKGQPWSDALILTRKNKEATRYAEALTKAGIPVVTENSMRLKGQPLVEQSIAFLKFLNNPTNDVAFQSIITGPLFLGHPQTAGLNQDELDILGLHKNGQSLYQTFRSRYPDIWEGVFKSFYEQSTLLAPYDAIKEWHRYMGAEERFPGQKLFLRSLLEVAQAAESSDIHSIPGFLDYWEKNGEDLRAYMPEGINAVKIMTIHKAKGLQAPMVIAPITLSAQKPRSTQHTKTIVKDFDDLPATAGKPLRLDLHLCKYYKPEYEQVMIQEALEILNLLYVAFTRAERELRIFTYTPAKGTGKKSSLLQDLALQAGLEFPYAIGQDIWADKEDLRDDDNPGEELQPGPFAGVASSTSWISRLKTARSKPFSRNSAAEKRGSFMHFCLENLCFSSDPASAARGAFDFGLAYSGIDLPPKEHKALLESLEWFASQPQVGQWLKDGSPEHSLLDEKGNELRVDLLVRDERGALVIDYKTGDFSDKNIEQVRNYLRCLEKSGRFSTPPAALLVYLDQKMFQHVTSAGASAPVSFCPDPWSEK